LVRAFGAIEAGKLEEFLDPVAKPGDVVVDVDAVETNYPTCWYRGPLPVQTASCRSFRARRRPARIAALGDGVKGLALGQRVAVQMENGAYASKVCVPERFCYPIPDGSATVHAAAWC
jgi:NADPH2:quinone reductase